MSLENDFSEFVSCFLILFMILLLGNKCILILWRQMYHLVHGCPSCFASGLEEMRSLVLTCSHQWTSETMALQGVQMRTLSKDLGPESSGQAGSAELSSLHVPWQGWLNYSPLHFPVWGPESIFSLGGRQWGWYSFCFLLIISTYFVHNNGFIVTFYTCINCMSIMCKMYISHIRPTVTCSCLIYHPNGLPLPTIPLSTFLSSL